MIRREGDYKSGFKYYKNNIEIKDKAEIECIRELKIPPAYQNVVIVNTRKIVAYGYDSKGRKQVLYQPAFVKKLNEKKFKKIFASMETFEKLKDIVEHDMKMPSSYISFSRADSASVTRNMRRRITQSV